ncbi:MAG: NAD(P)H-hydrate dehydratase [Verrucomicrobiota bacterium]
MPVPVLNVEQMRQWEGATWQAGVKEADVIAQVGRIVARRALELTRDADFILLLAGKGHNGDDVRQAQPHVGGRDVCLLNVTEPEASLAELQRHLQRRPALIVDGLFGIGLNRPLNDAWSKFIDAVNQSGARVLAVDTPSGLHADSGEPMGNAIQATVTLTLGAPKTGLLKPKTLAYVGRLEVAPEIGLVPCPHAGELNWTLESDFAGWPPRRRADAHKGAYGHVVIIAGSLGYHGAAVLAARGALAAMPGLVTVFTLPETYLPVASQLQAAMVHPWRPGAELPESATAVVIGPGLASEQLPLELKGAACALWQDSVLPVIADASALNWLPHGPTRPDTIRVITPHPGEAARMLQRKPAEVQANRVEALRELSAQWGRCWVALKGHQTLVGRNLGEVFINPTGNPGLAQGGSGDVLAGYLGGLLAQPVWQKNPSLTVRYAVWRHGAAADELAARQNAWGIEALLRQLEALR